MLILPDTSSYHLIGALVIVWHWIAGIEIFCIYTAVKNKLFLTFLVIKHSPQLWQQWCLCFCAFRILWSRSTSILERFLASRRSTSLPCLCVAGWWAAPGCLECWLWRGLSSTGERYSVTLFIISVRFICVPSLCPLCFFIPIIMNHQTFFPLTFFLVSTSMFLLCPVLPVDPTVFSDNNALKQKNGKLGCF